MENDVSELFVLSFPLLAHRLVKLSSGDFHLAGSELPSSLDAALRADYLMRKTSAMWIPG